MTILKIGLIVFCGLCVACVDSTKPGIQDTSFLTDDFISDADLIEEVSSVDVGVERYSSEVGGKYLNLNTLYDNFSPDFYSFYRLFKKNKNGKVYREYKKNIELKIKALDELVASTKFLEGAIVRTEKISTRKRHVKKEWVWGEGKENIKLYYKSFASPSSVYEYKIVFRSVDKNNSVLAESDVKTKKTDNAIIIYMYQINNDSKIYMIDPDTFITSML